MYNLFLDDFRYPEDCVNYTHNPIYTAVEWVIVRNYDEFVQTIERMGIPDIVSFDHDLADQHYAVYDKGLELDYLIFTEKTGYHCAEWLIYHCIDNKLTIPSKVYIHSMNPAGSRNIESLFKTYEKIHRGI